MVGFALLCGHLLGDFILQNDWLAANKTKREKVKCLSSDARKLMHDMGRDYREHLPETYTELEAWEQAIKINFIGNFACTLHCLLYTFAVWLYSSSWMPWWGLLVCFLVHWPIDRYRLAAFWMKEIAGQRHFANGSLAPWSVIVVDNTFHLLTLAVIAKLAGQ